MTEMLCAAEGGSGLIPGIMTKPILISTTIY